MEVDKGTCWYNDTCVKEMNHFYDVHIKTGSFHHEHMDVLQDLISLVEIDKGSEVIDIGCGTACTSEYLKQYTYQGCDLPHILANSSMRNYPNYYYRACDLIEDNIEWIKKYQLAIVNAVIDVMQDPLGILEKILSTSGKYVILHRQELSEEKPTQVIQNGSYGGYTYHSIINRNDFLTLIDKSHYQIYSEQQCGFSNWEGNGRSFLLRKKKSWSINDLDYKLHKYFKNKEKGFFIEAGANDGLRQSNTMFFEFYQDWSGVLIEPIIDEFNKIENNRSPKDIRLNYALVSNEDNGCKKKITYMPDCGGLMSIMNDACDYDTLSLRDTVGQIVYDVNCVSLDHVFHHYIGNKHVDLLSLDVENFEKQALSGLSLDKYPIDYILVEQFEESEFVKEYMKKYGYELIELMSEHDYLYSKNGNKNN